jgi:hypothetical protein
MDASHLTEPAVVRRVAIPARCRRRPVLRPDLAI